jgi:hypothetical protein
MLILSSFFSLKIAVRGAFGSAIVFELFIDGATGARISSAIASLGPE